MLFEYQQQPTFIQKYELIKHFFVQLQQVRQCEQQAHESSQPIERSKQTEESIKQEDSTTSRQVPKQRRAVYLKKEPRKSRDNNTSIIRPSDIMMIEQQKEKIDQFCRDNRVLHDNNKECMYLIKKMAKKIKQLKADSENDYVDTIQQLQLKLRIKDAEIAKKNECIATIREKYNQMIQLLEQHTIEEEKEWHELQQYQTQLETENVYLRRLLTVHFTDDQIKQMESSQNEVEMQFFDNFCISRKDLDDRVKEEYEKMLAGRKQKIEQQYVDWNMSLIQQHQQQPLEDLYAEEKEMMMKKQSQKAISKEDKQKIMEDLLKPIGSLKQAINVQEVKQKQLEILSNEQTPKQGNKKLAIDIEPKEEPQKVSSQKQQILNSLNQGWQKLMQTSQNRYQEEEEEDDQVTYDMKNHMFTNAKTIVYDNDDYMDDEEEDDVYQQIFEQQKKQMQKPTLTKTQKKQELQYQ